MRRLRDLFTLASRLRYLGWRAARSSREFRASLQTGERLIFRPAPATDLGVAYEVFVSEAYRPPRPLRREVHTIVDVGANVGYATVYLASRYPAARIIAFEPHPRHVGQLAKQLRANDLDRRVRNRRGGGGNGRWAGVPDR